MLLNFYGGNISRIDHWLYGPCDTTKDFIEEKNEYIIGLIKTNKHANIPTDCFDNSDKLASIPTSIAFLLLFLFFNSKYIISNTKKHDKKLYS